jgi:hypothetical protein
MANTNFNISQLKDENFKKFLSVFGVACPLSTKSIWQKLLPTIKKLLSTICNKKTMTVNSFSITSDVWTNLFRQT